MLFSQLCHQKSIFLDLRKLHYGALYAGVPTYQTLTITNVSKETLEVLLSTDLAGEVSFDVDVDIPDPLDDEGASKDLLSSPSVEPREG